MLQKIFDVLVRCRSYAYAVTSDIQSAFLNIRVNENDRDYLRFLWIDDIHRADPLIIMKRFTSVLFGLGPSPFLLGATVSTHMEKYLDEYRTLVKKFLRDLYMDDSVSGAQTKKNAIEWYKVCGRLMKEGGFILRKWISNDDDIQESIFRLENEKIGEEAGDDKKADAKVLGVKWRPQEDHFIFSLDDLVRKAKNYEGPITKRHMAKITASHYDPLGFFSPISVRFKCLVQEACQQKLPWDDIIEG